MTTDQHADRAADAMPTGNVIPGPPAEASVNRNKALAVLLRLTEAASAAVTHGGLRGTVRAHLILAVDQAWEILDPTRGAGHDRPADTSAARLAAAAVPDGHRPPSLIEQRTARHLAAAGLDPAAWQAAGLDPARWAPSPWLDADMRRIATTHRAVEYDVHEIDTERAAIITAAVRAGLTPVPSDSVPPRSYRGCAPPAPDEVVLVHPPTLGDEAQTIRWVGLPDAPTGAPPPDGADEAEPEVAPDTVEAVEAALDAIRPVLTLLHAGGKALGRTPNPDPHAVRLLAEIRDGATR